MRYSMFQVIWQFNKGGIYAICIRHADRRSSGMLCIYSYFIVFLMGNCSWIQKCKDSFGDANDEKQEFVISNATDFKKIPI